MVFCPRDKNEKTLYDHINKQIKKPAPSLVLNSIKYKEVVYPREENTYRKRNRGRTDYVEVAGYEYKGFDQLDRLISIIKKNY